MLRAYVTDLLIVHKKLLSISLCYRVICENVLVKMQKLQLCYYPDGLMVNLVPTACTGSYPAKATYLFSLLGRGLLWNLSIAAFRIRTRPLYGN